MTGATGGASGDAAKKGGPPVWLAVIAVLSLLLAVVIMVLTVLGVGLRGTGPAPTMAPTGEAAARTHDQVRTTLEAAAFQVQDPQTPYRPGESPALIEVPRRLLQVILPDDPDKGYVVVYELPTNGEADRAGRDFLAYLGSGPGAIQYPRDAQFVLQRVGRTLVFFEWSAEVSPDPRVADLAATLTTVGEKVLP